MNEGKAKYKGEMVKRLLCTGIKLLTCYGHPPDRETVAIVKALFVVFCLYYCYHFYSE